MPARSLALCSALVCLLTRSVLAQTGDDPPSAPADLVANVYSATAGAVSWSRSTDDRGAVPGYELTRDGVVLGVFDALSHVEFMLDPDTTYEYAVTAIDNAGQRSTTSVVSLRTRPLGDFGPVTGPGKPAELRATLWSATAAGLAWRRAVEFGTRYIVSRDGEVLRDDTAFPLGTFGPTYSDFDLTPGRDHVYGIVAVDAHGRRSAPATLTVNTDGLVDGDDGPRMPRGLRAEVWSRTALGLSWERSPEFGTRYIVRRDGEIVRDGTSFDLGAFGPTYSDFDLVPGVHDYTVVAVDLQGRRSPFAGVSVDTLGDSGSGGDRVDLLHTDNAVTVIAQTFDLFRGDPWADIVTALPGFPRPLQPPFDARVETPLSCLDGGAATLRYIGGPRRSGRGYVFDDCREGGSAFDGQIDNVQEEFYRAVTSGEGSFSLTRPDNRLVEFSGRVLDARDNDTLFVAEPMSFARYEVETIPPRSFRILDELFVKELRFQYGVEPMAPVPTVELSGTIEFVSDEVASALVYATTPDPLRRAVDFPLPDLDSPLFTEGSLRIEASDDGSFILLEANNGDEASARVTVDGAFGGRTSFDEPWSTWRENLLFD